MLDRQHTYIKVLKKIKKFLKNKISNIISSLQKNKKIITYEMKKEIKKG